VHNVNRDEIRVGVVTLSTYAVRNVNRDGASGARLTKCTGNRARLPQCRRSSERLILSYPNNTITK